MPLTKQTLLLNKEAILLDSCDSLFATHELINENIIPYFPFLESIFQDLLHRLNLESDVRFLGVATKHTFLPGYYDYTFNLISKNGKKIIQWEILDATDIYNNQKRQQQFYQEKVISLNPSSRRKNQ